MRRHPHENPGPDALNNFQSFRPLHSIIHYYVDLSTFFVSANLAGGWWVLNRRKRVRSLYEIEVEYGKLPQREAFFTRCFQACGRTKKILFEKHLGFDDLFVPVLRGSRVLGFLQSGSFARAVPTPEQVLLCWKELTGRDHPYPFIEFQRFTKDILAVPVLDQRAAPALAEVLALFADVLAGTGDALAASERSRELLETVFARGFAHSYWQDWAIGRSTTESVPSWGRHIERWDWIRKEIGISRIPTTVIAVMPTRIELFGDAWLERRVRLHRLQRNAARFARSFAETTGGPLEDYGLLFLTSPPPDLTRKHRNAWIMELAGKIRDFARQAFEEPVRVGVGQAVQPGEPLRECARQAISTVHVRAQSERQPVLYVSDPVENQAENAVAEPLDEAGRRLLALTKAATVANSVESQSRLDSYLESVLAQRSHDPLLIKTHLRYGHLLLSQSMARAKGFSESELQSIGLNFCAGMDSAVTEQDALVVFRDHFEHLCRSSDTPRALKLVDLMETIGRRLNANPAKAPHLDVLALELRLGKSTLSRAFIKWAGVTYGRYVLALKIKEAKRLLTQSHIAVARVALKCGYTSVPTFTSLFRRETGMSPTRFRAQYKSSPSGFDSAV